MLTGETPASATSGSPQIRDDEQQTESYAAPDMDKLGRERPQIFSSIFSEICFIFSIVMSQILAVSCTQNCPSPIQIEA